MCGGNGSFNLRLCVWACNIHSVRLVCSSCLALLWMQIRYPPIIVPWPPLVWTPDHSGRVWGITLLRLEFHEIYILHALFSYLQCDRSANFQYSMSCHAFTLIVELKHRLVGGCFCLFFFVVFFLFVCLFVCFPCQLQQHHSSTQDTSMQVFSPDPSQTHPLPDRRVWSPDCGICRLQK